MTRVTRRTSRHTATIWPIVSKGDYGQINYGQPYTITCTYEQGSSRQYNNSQGQMYIPKSIFWYEMPSKGKPSQNDYIALGDHVLTLDPNKVDGAETVEVSTLQDSAVLNDTPDVMVLT